MPTLEEVAGKWTGNGPFPECEGETNHSGGKVEEVLSSFLSTPSKDRAADEQVVGWGTKQMDADFKALTTRCFTQPTT